MKNPNPSNSTLIESLLEILRSEAPAELKTTTKQLNDMLQSMPTFTKQIDGIVSGKGYSDSSVAFGRRYRQINAKLDPVAAQIFDIATQICPQSQLVQLPTQLICEDLGISKKTFLSALKSLLLADYIRVKAKHNTRAGTPTTYMINPAVYSCCKPSHYQKRLAEYESLEHDEVQPFQTVDFETVKSMEDGNYMTVSRYKGIADKEKESSSDKPDSEKDVSRPKLSKPSISYLLDVSQDIDTEMPF